jgi:hypothetical protein
MCSLLERSRFPAGSPNVRFGNSTYAVLQPPIVNNWVWAVPTRRSMDGWHRMFVHRVNKQTGFSPSLTPHSRGLTLGQPIATIHLKATIRNMVGPHSILNLSTRFTHLEVFLGSMGSMTSREPKQSLDITSRRSEAVDLPSGLTANRKNLPNASELYPAFDVSSCSSQPALCNRPLLALPVRFRTDLLEIDHLPSIFKGPYQCIQCNKN